MQQGKVWFFPQLEYFISDWHMPMYPDTGLCWDGFLRLFLNALKIVLPWAKLQAHLETNTTKMQNPNQYLILQLSLLSLQLCKIYRISSLRAKSIGTTNHCTAVLPWENSSRRSLGSIFFFKYGNIFMSIINKPYAVDSFVRQQFGGEASRLHTERY